MGNQVITCAQTNFIQHTTGSGLCQPELTVMLEKWHSLRQPKQAAELHAENHHFLGKGSLQGWDWRGTTRLLSVLQASIKPVSSRANSTFLQGTTRSK